MTIQFAERTKSGWRLCCQECKVPCDHVTPAEMTTIVSSFWPTYCLDCWKHVEHDMHPLENGDDKRPFWLTMINPSTGLVDMTVLVNTDTPEDSVVVDIIEQANLRKLQEAIEAAVINGVIGNWKTAQTVYLVAHISKDGRHNGQS